MTTTKDTVRPPIEIPELDVRPAFNANSLAVLIAEINDAPEILRGDWRGMVRAAFQLSAEQARSLVEIAPKRVEEIQTYFDNAVEYIRHGGKITGRIIKLPVEEQTPAAVHEVRIELVELPTAAPPPIVTGPRMLRIAHCDANCRNWHWNSL